MTGDKEQHFSKDFQLTPEGASYFVEQPLLDAGDPEAAVIATVHKVRNRSVANVWMRTKEGTKKVASERILESEPSPLILIGEATRLSQVSLGLDPMRENLTKNGLYGAAKAMVESEKGNTPE